DELLNERQAEPAPADSAALRRQPTLEPTEESRLQLLTETDARVANLEHGARGTDPLDGVQVDVDAPSLRRELHRVREEIHEHALDRGRVQSDGTRAGDPHSEFESGRASRRLPGVDDTHDDLTEVARYELEPNLVLAALGEEQ